VILRPIAALCLIACIAGCASSPPAATKLPAVEPMPEAEAMCSRLDYACWLFHQVKHHYPSDVREFSAFLLENFSPDWIEGVKLIRIDHSNYDNFSRVTIILHINQGTFGCLLNYDITKIYRYQLCLGTAEVPANQFNVVFPKIFARNYSFDSPEPTKADLDSLCLVALTKLTARWTGAFDLNQVNFVKMADGVPVTSNFLFGVMTIPDPNLQSQP
jgi:hypothetical protein